LHYPPIPEGVDPRCVRAAAHEDINFITILPAATTIGVFNSKDRDGTWLDIESDYGTLIVDAGDMLARITNDVIPSTTHRVINPQDGQKWFEILDAILYAPSSRISFKLLTVLQRVLERNTLTSRPMNF